MVNTMSGFSDGSITKKWDRDRGVGPEGDLGDWQGFMHEAFHREKKGGGGLIYNIFLDLIMHRRIINFQYSGSLTFIAACLF